MVIILGLFIIGFVQDGIFNIIVITIHLIVALFTLAPGFLIPEIEEPNGSTGFERTKAGEVRLYGLAFDSWCFGCLRVLQYAHFLQLPYVKS